MLDDIVLISLDDWLSYLNGYELDITDLVNFPGSTGAKTFYPENAPRDYKGLIFYQLTPQAIEDLGEFRPVSN